MSRHKDLPIMVGKNLRKGIFAYRDSKIGGYNVCILWLKKDYQSGEQYALEDMDKINGVLHFCDRESVERMIKVLQLMLEWGINEHDNS